jgi:hypothetical protein
MMLFSESDEKARQTQNAAREGNALLCRKEKGHILRGIHVVTLFKVFSKNRRA